MSTVKAFHKGGNYLGYAVLSRIFNGLSRKEALQLTDYILYTYCDVDFEKAVSYYGSMEKMILAIDSNTGSEHDIKEEWVGYTDAVYAHMGKLIRKKTGQNDLKSILKWSEKERRTLYAYLLTQSTFIERQVEKYLQLPNSSLNNDKNCFQQ